MGTEDRGIFVKTTTGKTTAPDVEDRVACTITHACTSGVEQMRRKAVEPMRAEEPDDDDDDDDEEADEDEWVEAQEKAEARPIEPLITSDQRSGDNAQWVRHKRGTGGSFAPPLPSLP